MPDVDSGTWVNKTNFLCFRVYRGGTQMLTKSTNKIIIQQVEKDSRARERG